MKEKITNRTHVEGTLYEIGASGRDKLQLKVSGPDSKAPGTEFISGSLFLATDNAMTNVIGVHFGYVTAKTKAGKDNETFKLLKSIIDGKYKAYTDTENENKEDTIKLRIDTSLDLNEWYDTREQEPKLISIQCNDGMSGFVHIVTDELNEDEKARATFEVDMLITNVFEKDADEERGIPARAVVKGAIFDFRKTLKPAEFTIENPNGMNYFLNLDASPKTPIFTRVWGTQINTTIKEAREEETAFGEKRVTFVEKTRKEFLIQNAAKDTYEFDMDTEPSTVGMSVGDLTKAIADREVYLSTLLQDQLKREAAKKASATSANNSAFGTPPTDSFNF